MMSLDFLYLAFYLLFFVSSRGRHTISDRDWSSDVCSSDLPPNSPAPNRLVKATERSILAERNAYLAAIGNIDLSVAFTKRFGAGLFGGEGFILQKISGQGLLFLHAGGNMLEFELAPGEQLRVDTGCIVSFAETVTYDIQFVGGFRNALFGGGGLFYATLSGPGHVVLQTPPFSRLANRIAAAVGSRKDESKGLAGLASGVLGGI